MKVLIIAALLATTTAHASELVFPNQPAPVYQPDWTQQVIEQQRYTQQYTDQINRENYQRMIDSQNQQLQRERNQQFNRLGDW